MSLTPIDASPRARRIRNVIFDLGGVVLDWNPEAILARHYPQPEHRALLRTGLFEHPDWLELDRGTLEEHELLERFRRRAGAAAPPVADLLRAVRESLLPKPATLELIEQLRAHDVPLYCLSNMPAGIYAELRARHDFFDAFDGIVISAHVGLIKPEPAIYEHLLSAHGLKAEESVFIDDLARNVQGARSVGLAAIQFRDVAQCERELNELVGPMGGYPCSAG